MVAALTAYGEDAETASNACNALYYLADGTRASAPRNVKGRPAAATAACCCCCRRCRRCGCGGYCCC